MNKCECGHESCYHIIEPKKKMEISFFKPAPTNPLAKKCNIPGCQCLRYTPPPPENL